MPFCAAQEELERFKEGELLRVRLEERDRLKCGPAPALALPSLPLAPCVPGRCLTPTWMAHSRELALRRQELEDTFAARHEVRLGTNFWGLGATRATGTVGWRADTGAAATLAGGECRTQRTPAGGKPGHFACLLGGRGWCWAQPSPVVWAQQRLEATRAQYERELQAQQSELQRQIQALTLQSQSQPHLEVELNDSRHKVITYCVSFGTLNSALWGP